MDKIKIENLVIQFNGTPILSDFDLSVREGEFVTVLGHSGSGKTTLLNIIAGALKPDQGSVLVDQKPVEGISDHVAYMPQDDLLLPWKNILDNVTLYGRINGNQAQASKEALANMDAFGLQGYEYRYPHQLSGGMRQRAAFLRTSLCGADTLLLDEPFASLDVITRGEMQKWLFKMKSRLNKTVLLVSHDIDEALLLSDRIIVISGQPSSIREEIIIDEGSRDEEWLTTIGEKKRDIIRLLGI